METKTLLDRFMNVWESFCEYYDECMIDYQRLKEIDNFIGPHFRMEGDIAFHLARLCLDEFGKGWVHLGSPIYKMYFSQLPAKPTRRIDIDVTEPRRFMTANAKRGILVEVKYIWDGCSDQPWGKAKDKSKEAEADIERLLYLFKKGCCDNAVMVIIDEEPHNSGIDQDRIVEWESKHSPVKVLVKRYER